MTEKPKESKRDRALKLARQGLSIKEIREQGIGRTYAKQAVQIAQKEQLAKGEIPEKRPEFEAKPEPVESSLMEKLRAKEKEEEKEEVEEKEVPPTEVSEGIPKSIEELDIRTIVKNVWKTYNVMIAGKRLEQEDLNVLTDIWTPVAEKHLKSKEFIEKWGLEVFALFLTLTIIAPDIKNGIQKIRAWREKRLEQPKPTTKKE